MPEKKPPRILFIPAPIWMVSFGDTVALMLAFFVMLFAMSSLDDSKIARIIAAISSDDIDTVNIQPTPNSNRAIENVNLFKGINTAYIYRLLQTKISDVPILSGIEIQQNTDEVLLVLPNNIFQKDNETEITETGHQILYELGLILATIGNAIHIEGYNIPARIENPQDTVFTNRWEIRLLRAVSVAQSIRESGLLASNQIFGWSQDVSRISKEQDVDTRMALRITSIAGGQ